MFTFVLVIHILVSLLLVGIVLVQSGRGGGLVDSFSGVESMFGTKTSAFLTRSTAVLATLFIVTCLTLTILSSRQGRSILENVKTLENVTQSSIPRPQLPFEEKTASTQEPQPQATP